MRRNPFLWLGMIGCSIIVIILIFGPYFPKVDTHVTKTTYILGDGGNLDFILPPYPPSERFPLGSDSSGMDIYSALIMGTRPTILYIGLISFLTFLFAVPFGILSAHIKFFKKILEGWNYLLSRIPVFFFIALLTTIPFFIFSNYRPVWMITLLIILETGKVAEFIHNSVKEIQKTTYYDAAIVSGTKIFGLFKWYYVPGCFSQWLSYFILHMGNMLFLFGQLGFFNIFLSQKLVSDSGIIRVAAFYDVVNTSITWPTFLANTFLDINNCPWVPISAGVFITFTIFSFISLGKGILQYSLWKQKGLIPRREQTLLSKSTILSPLFKKAGDVSK
jgi:peptide/nickel transport system permease protein